MPLYLVRWPMLSASLVRAASEEHLLDILDQVDNAEGCEWSVYKGPVFIDFDLEADIDVQRRPGRPMTDEDVVVNDVAGVRAGLKLSIAACDDGWEMREAIEEFAYPNIRRSMQEVDQPDDVDEKTLAEAVRRDLQILIRASWRDEAVQRADDPASRLAKMMGMPVALAKTYLAEEARRSARKPRPPKGGGGAPKGKGSKRGKSPRRPQK